MAGNVGTWGAHSERGSGRCFLGGAAAESETITQRLTPTFPPCLVGQRHGTQDVERGWPSRAKQEACEDEENGRRCEKYEVPMRRQMRAEHAVWIAGGNVRRTSRCSPRREMDVGNELLLAPPRKTCEAQERTKVLVWDARHAQKNVARHRRGG